MLVGRSKSFSLYDFDKLINVSRFSFTPLRVRLARETLIFSYPNNQTLCFTGYSLSLNFVFFSLQTSCLYQ